MNVSETLKNMRADKDCLPPDCYVSRVELERLLEVAELMRDMSTYNPCYCGSLGKQCVKCLATRTLAALEAD